MALRLIGLALLVLAQNLLIAAEKCDNDGDNGKFMFPRTYLIMASGRAEDYPTRETLKWALGDCASMDGLLRDVVDYFKPYGVNLERVRSDPAVEIDNDDFYFGAANVDPKSNYRIVFETFYEYAKYRDEPIVWLSWKLWAKKDLVGPSRTLPAGFLDGLGIFRVNTHGRDFCIDFNSKPVPSFNHTVGPIDLTLHNKYWGDGAARGIFTNNNGTYDLRYMFTFPAQF